MNLRLEARTAASSRDGERVHKLASELFDALRTATSDGVGITRESYGKGESAALDIIDAKARALGLRTERDAGANLVATLEGTQPQLPFLACGSHLDSVPQGGNFDGAAGVVVIVAGRPFAVMGFTVAEGKIVEIDTIADPERVRRIAAAVLTDE